MRKIRKAIYGITLWLITPVLYAVALFQVWQASPTQRVPDAGDSAENN